MALTEQRTAAVLQYSSVKGPFSDPITKPPWYTTSDRYSTKSLAQTVAKAIVYSLYNTEVRY